MDIISKKSGPRAEDQQAKQHLQRNWGTIEKLADTLSGGKYSADKARKASAYAALWLFISLLAGAFVASLCATYGGRRRDA